MGARTQELDYRKLRAALRRWRLEAKLTQRALAAILKKPHSFVYKAEVGNRRLDVLEFKRWCKACGLDPILSRP